MPPCPLDELTQVPQPFLIMLALPRIPWKRHQPRQDCLEPHPVHARGGQARQVPVRVRIQRGLEQRIAVESEIRIAIPRGKGTGTQCLDSGTLGWPRQLLDEIKQRLLGFTNPFREFRAQNAGDLPGALASAIIGRTIPQWLALRLKVTQLDE